MAGKNVETKNIRKVKLTDSPSDPVTLIAICSSENEFRLSWLLNAELSTNFSRHDSHSVDRLFLSEGDIYLSPDPNWAILLANKAENGGYLLPKQKKFDFILGLKKSVEEEQVRALVAKIRKVPGVITAILVEDPSKAVQNLLSLF